MPESAESKKQRRRQVREYIACVKSASSCCNCGESRSACLDFHHKDRSEKSFELSKSGGKGITTVKSEIKKCIVICANCHRVLHAEEKAEAISLAKAEEVFPLFD